MKKRIEKYINCKCHCANKLERLVQGQNFMKRKLHWMDSGFQLVRLKAALNFGLCSEKANSNLA